MLLALNARRREKSFLLSCQRHSDNVTGVAIRRELVAPVSAIIRPNFARRPIDSAGTLHDPVKSNSIR